MDNVFIERLWRSLKYEDIYLKGYSDGHEAKAGIARWIEFYNFQRPHQALENRAPMAVWRAGVTGAFGEEAVDMTLLASEKLGQRCALPTSPQLQRQQATVAQSYWEERTAAAPLKKPDPVVLGVGSTSTFHGCSTSILPKIAIARERTMRPRTSPFCVGSPSTSFEPTPIAHPYAAKSSAPPGTMPFS